MSVHPPIWLGRINERLRSVLGMWYGWPAVCFTLAAAILIHTCLLLASSPYATNISLLAFAMIGLCIFAVGVVCVAWSALLAPCSLLSLWCAWAMFNGLDGRMPLPMSALTIFAVIAATFRLADRHPILGTVVVILPIYACLVMVMNMEEGGGIPRLLFMCLGELAAVIMAIVIRKNRELTELRQRESQRMLRDRIEHTLHDSTANTIVYALSLVGMMQGSGSLGESGRNMRHDAVLDDLDGALWLSLAQVRDVINLVESSDDGHPKLVATGVDVSGRVKTIVNRMRVHLGQLGFEAELMFDDDSGSTGGNAVPERLKLVEGLLNELEGNIIKHADPNGVVTMSVCLRPSDIVISLADDSLSQQSCGMQAFPLSGGNGLSRYRRLVEGAGGVFAVREENSVWSLNATIPVMA